MGEAQRESESRMTALLSVAIPMQLPSAGNLHEHWRKRHARVKAQRAAVQFCIRRLAGLLEAASRLTQGQSLVVVLTRVSPRKLDSDNLAFAFKACRDQVAEELGIDDGSDSVGWLYRQESGTVGIRIEIRTAPRLTQGATL